MRTLSFLETTMMILALGVELYDHPRRIAGGMVRQLGSISTSSG
jgi:hypothetical protein